MIFTKLDVRSIKESKKNQCNPFFTLNLEITKSYVLKLDFFSLRSLSCSDEFFCNIKQTKTCVYEAIYVLCMNKNLQC